MYPQTHVYFAEMVLGCGGDDVVLGSVLPDMLTGSVFDHLEAHTKAMDIFSFLRKEKSLLGFGQAAATHGFVPKGLDYYGDEKYLHFEKGYCFEKARALVEETVAACRIPPEMGWWKAHNIIEMGVELLISERGAYGKKIKKAFFNEKLALEVENKLVRALNKPDIGYSRRVKRFAEVVELDVATPASLAAKYRLQMLYRHRIEIDVGEVARLIDKAKNIVAADVDEFFRHACVLVAQNLKEAGVIDSWPVAAAAPV